MSVPAVIAEVRTAIEKMAPSFKAALPAHVPVERFVRTVLTSIQTNPGLLDADRRTLFAAATKAAQMGLLPDGREGAIVQFKGSAQWMPMVAGLMKLVRNSGEISTWSVQAVYENDEFEYELGDSERIAHRPALRNRGAVIGAYSIVTMRDGERSREFMGVDEIEAIRKRSRSGNAGPWVSDFAEMAKKTVVRRHAKRLPMSTDLDDALRQDDDLLMPETVPASVAENQTPSPAPAPVSKPQRRASRLQSVAESAPPADVLSIDEDGVIDVPATESEPESVDSDESPI